mmetsp:Transcript_14256/g.16349  ORF Transcript_14256/g.16349 Transcript_14256/m.16349 type:complete len:135 (-) Transcript_14256:31-435(-)
MEKYNTALNYGSNENNVGLRRSSSRATFLEPISDEDSIIRRPSIVMGKSFIGGEEDISLSESSSRVTTTKKERMQSKRSSLVSIHFGDEDYSFDMSNSDEYDGYDITHICVVFLSIMLTISFIGLVVSYFVFMI